MLNYKLITDFQILCGYKESWDQLLQNSNADKLFMCFDWIYEWFSCFGNDKHLQVYFIYKDNFLIGILPLVIRKKEGFKQLNIIGTGKSDYLDFIFHKDYQLECIDFLINYVFENTAGWDVFHCSQLLNDNTVNIEIINKLKNRNSANFTFKKFSEAPYIKIKEDWSEYKKNLSKNILQDTRRRCNRIGKEIGTLKYELLKNFDDIEQNLNKIFEFHIYRREKIKKGVSMFIDTNNRNFYINICRKLFNKGLHLSCSLCNDNVIAMHLGFIISNKFYYLVPVINWEYQRYSSGRLHLMSMIEESYNLKLNEFDFCYGGEEYKYQFATNVRDINEIYYYKKSLKGKMAYYWFNSFRTMLSNNRILRHKIYKLFFKRKIVKQ